MGIGSHVGKKATLILFSAPANIRVIYHCIDLNLPVDSAADTKSVRDTMFLACLVNKYDVRSSTLEYFDTALAGLGIDNIVVEVDAPEVLIMNDSANPFIYLLMSKGVEELSSTRKLLRIRETLYVEDGDKLAELRPFSGP